MHMEKYGIVETRAALVIPLGTLSRTNTSASEEQELSMNKTQYEDIAVFMARVDGKTPEVIADLINLKSSREFTCTSCYAVGEHRDNCIYDCPQAQE